MKKTLYVKVTKDKYQLPVAVADDMHQLAAMLGIKYNTVAAAFCRKSKSYYRVEVEVEDDGEDQ